MGPVTGSHPWMPHFDLLCCVSYLYVLWLYKGSGCSHHEHRTIPLHSGLCEYCNRDDQQALES